jgi:hypothetical protein
MKAVHLLRGALTVVLAAVLASSCASKADLKADAGSEVPSDSAPFLIGVGYPIAAALGDSLVVVNPESFSITDVAFAARYTTEGRWTTVPEPPEDFKSVALAANGDRLALAGATCEADCETSSILFFDLGEGEAEWTQVGPTLKVQLAEPELSALPGVGAAVFSTPSGWYHVTPDRKVVRVAASDAVSTGSSFTCVAGNFLFQVQSAVTNLVDGVIEGPIEQQVQGAQLLDLTQADAKWEVVESPPMSLTSAGNGACTSDGAVFLVNGMQTAFESQNKKWAGPTRTEIDGSIASFGRSVAISPMGDLYGILADSHSVVIRDSAGMWRTTTQKADALFSTSGMVLGTSLNDRTVYSVESP